MRKFAYLALLPILMAACPQAHAQGTPPAADRWRFDITPYIWFSGISGDVTLPRGGARDFSADFGDIFDNLKFAAMASAEARYGRFGLLLDFFYVDLEQGFNSPRSLTVSNGNVQFSTTQFAAVGLVRLVEDRNWWLDAGAGIRAWWLDSEIKANGGLFAGRSSSASSNWVDPLVALRGQVRLNDRFALTAYGDVGGFDTNTRLTWQAIAALDWQVTPSIAARLGYRYISVDRSRSNIDADFDLSGPFIGASFRF
jgi:opacity protein-like surface antigen